jgi:hypothetical protein
MAVTRQNYSALGPWSVQTLADLFRSAFIDAGLMTEWHDSFAVGALEHRILEVVYDPNKTWGKVYYWFIFTTTGAFVTISTGWDTTFKRPSGTQYYDYYSNLTNTTSNHSSFAGTLTTQTEISLIRYTSGERPTHSWFVLRNGANPLVFHIAPKESQLVPWIDLDQTVFHHFIDVRPAVVSSTSTTSLATTGFFERCTLRRSFRDSQVLRSSTSASSGYFSSVTLHSYRAQFLSDSNSNFTPDESNGRIAVPYRLAFTGTSTTSMPFTESYTPILYGASYSPYLTESLPSDFAIHFPFTVTSFSFGDTVIVTPGVEEWEVLRFANNNQSSSANPLFLARLT